MLFFGDRNCYLVETLNSVSIMGGEMVTESWFSSLWRTSRESIVSEPENAVIGILTFEVASLMFKVVNLWQCLGDRQIVRLREEIVNSVGIRKLVSDNDDYLMDLALAEIIENLGCLATSVARLGKRCTDPVYHRLEHVLENGKICCCCWEKVRFKGLPVSSRKARSI